MLAFIDQPVIIGIFAAFAALVAAAAVAIYFDGEGGEASGLAA